MNRLFLSFLLLLCALVLICDGQGGWGRGRNGNNGNGRGRGWGRGGNRGRNGNNGRQGGDRETEPPTTTTEPQSDTTTTEFEMETVQANAEDETDELSPEAKSAIKAACAGGKCKGQSAETKERREAVKALRIAEFLEQNGGNQAQAEASAENLLTKIQAAKIAVLEAEGLDEDVEPEDDGIWGKDMALSEEQADQIAEKAKSRGGRIKQPEGGTETESKQKTKEDKSEQSDDTSGDQDRNQRQGRGRGGNRGRGKRNALYFEDYWNYKWGSPVPYVILSGFSSYERGLIYSAVRDIEYKTCLRFQEVSDSYNAPRIRFYRYASSYFCGQSPLGKQSYYNTVYLNMGCSNMMSITVHEILHSLGIHHEQTRQDRDYYITINWNNVNAQNYDFFDKSYMYQYTSYGVPYDYYSVMHYSAYAASINGGQTMTARVSPVTSNTQAMGNRSNGLTNRDAEKVRRMYCKNSCPDSDVFCGHWANVGYCSSNSYVWTYCRKSCNYC